MDRYGEAIEADLADRGIDLLDFFRRRRSWRQLLVILDHLPRASHFRQAVADDEEWAEEVLKRQDTRRVAPPPSVPLSEYSREAELLTIIGDLLQTINANIRSFGEKNVPRPTPLPRPRTALDRLKDQRRNARMDALIAEVEDAMNRWPANEEEEAARG